MQFDRHYVQLNTAEEEKTHCDSQQWDCLKESLSRSVKLHMPAAFWHPSVVSLGFELNFYKQF